jgi:hypothetical protein
VLALETLRGVHVVADPAALDAARWDGDPDAPAPVTVLRFASDEAFAVGARGVEIDDDHAIVEDEVGYVGAWLSADELDRVVVPRLECPLPTGKPALAQGLIAGVSARLWLPDKRPALLLTAAPFAAELEARLR